MDQKKKKNILAEVQAPIITQKSFEIERFSNHNSYLIILSIGQNSDQYFRIIILSPISWTQTQLINEMQGRKTLCKGITRKMLLLLIDMSIVIIFFSFPTIASAGKTSKLVITI
jgi:hypothetical protein